MEIIYFIKIFTSKIMQVVSPQVSSETWKKWLKVALQRGFFISRYWDNTYFCSNWSHYNQKQPTLTKVTYANGAPKIGRSFIFTHVINMIQQCGTQANGQQCNDVTLKQGWNEYKQMKMVEEWTETDIQTHTSRPGNLNYWFVLHESRRRPSCVC